MWCVPTKWLRHSFEVHFSYISIDYSSPLPKALKCDKDHGFTRICHQGLKSLQFFEKTLFKLIAIVTAITGTLPL